MLGRRDGARDGREAGLPWGWWEAAVWEGSSHAVLLALIPAIAGWNRRFPLHWDTLARHLPWHLLGSVLFSLAHVAGMVALRHALHAAAGQSYGFGPWWSEWGYEYLKDVRAYATIVGSLTVYRVLLLRLQGEARVLDAPEPPLPARPARFVQVHRSHLVNLDRIVEIEPLDSGDARLHLRGGGVVPCSRRHRAALEAAITGATATG